MNEVKSMLRDDLVQAITDKLCSEGNKVTNEDVASMLQILLKEIAERVNEGRSVCIRGFGTFKPKIYRGHSNPEMFDEANRAKLQDSVFARISFKPGLVFRNLK